MIGLGFGSLRFLEFRIFRFDLGFFRDRLGDFYLVEDYFGEYRGRERSFWVWGWFVYNKIVILRDILRI